MNTKNLVTIGGIVLCLIVGEMAFRKPGTVVPTPEPEPVVVCQSWQATIAARIPERIKSADELTLILLEMHGAGDISDADLRAFQDALPDLVSRDRPLTSDDAGKVRALAEPRPTPAPNP